MSLKAGRVGVNPADVDPINGHINSESVDSYTKAQADNKFATIEDAQPKRLTVPISMLSGSLITSLSTVEDVIATMNNAPTNMTLLGRMKNMFKKVVYSSYDPDRSSITLGAGSTANIEIPSMVGYSVVSYMVHIDGVGSSVNSAVSGASTAELIKIINFAGQSYTWNYQVTVFYIKNEYIE